MVAALLLVSVVFVDTLRPLGLGARYESRPFELAPPQADLDFYAALEGEDAIFELPVRPEQLRTGSAGTLHSAYHGRRTSSCYHPALVPPELSALSEQMPSEPAIARLRELGFDAVVIHHPARDLFGPRRRRSFDEFAAGSASLEVSAALGTPRLTGYRIAKDGDELAR
jgi:hypothetical protein